LGFFVNPNYLLLMKLFEVYEDIVIENSWGKLEEILQSGLFQEEGDSKLNELLEKSQLLIFKAFDINPKEKGKYFVSGSARLFKNPRLLSVLNKHDKSFELVLGDLDVVIPNQENWETLYSNYTNTNSEFIKELSQKINKSPEDIKSKFLEQKGNFTKGIYRPGIGGMELVNDDMEAFKVWDPSKAKDAKDMSVRSQSDILKDSVNIGGYFFMNIKDVFDYKSKLSREKEKNIVAFLKDYLTGEESPQRAEELFNKIGEELGKDK